MNTTTPQNTIIQAAFGSINGQEISLFTFTNKHRNTVSITNLGGIVTDWSSADKNGNRSSIVIGFSKLDSYIPNHPHFGALVGRYANRIAKGKFSLDGREYTLATNNGPNHLHGGIKNFSQAIWTPTLVANNTALALTYFSADGEEGYPGNLTTTVHYCFTDNDELEITYEATTDKPTVLNLTNHCYFNLTGDVANTIGDNIIQINATHYTPVDAGSIPTGEIAPVAGTPYDLTQAQRLDKDWLAAGDGYDHNFVLNNNNASVLAATVTEATSGRKLEVYTTQPGIQLYTGNSLDGTQNTDYGTPITRHSAFALETQHYPDSPNHPHFPTTRLNPGEQFHSVTIYKLSLV